MKIILGGLLVMCGVLTAFELPVVPAVKEWQPTNQQVNITNVKICVDKRSKQLFKAAEMLASDLLANKQKVTIGKVEANKICFTLDPNLDKEEYILIISAEGIQIKAANHTGAYYAGRTIMQLSKQYENNIPCGTIKDKPTYKVRSILIDVGRKFIPLEGLKDWVRMLSWVKMNEIHLHLNDNSWGKYPGYRLESKRFPGLASKDGFYTWKQIRELQDFAKLHGVTIVPELDTPGHALALTSYRPDLAHPQLNHSGFGLAYLDIRKKETYQFVEELLDEIVPLFDAKDFHIGTDEYRLGLIRNKKEREEAGELFRKYINHFNKYITTKFHKNVRIWSGYEHMPGTTQPDKSVIIDMWVTADANNKAKEGYKFINSSHHFTYIVPGMPYYGINNKYIYEHWTPHMFSRKPEGLLPADAKGLLGGKIHVWNDGGPTGYTWNEIARLTFPSMQVFAEKLWGTKGCKNYKEFSKMITKISTVPNTKIMTRDAEVKGTIWKLKEKKYFISTTHKKLNLAHKSKNLEYPWTATFTIIRTSDNHKKFDTIIGSDLATFCLDAIDVVTNKKTKKTTTHQGVACIRAFKAPADRPIHAYRPEILSFDYQIPLNKEVTLTFIGEKKSTSLYVDGKLIKKIRKQMICPLQYLGDIDNSTFQGIIKNAEILDFVKKPKQKK